VSRRTTIVLGAAVAVLAAGLATGAWSRFSPEPSSRIVSRAGPTTVAPPRVAAGPSTTAGPVLGPTRPEEPGRTLRLGYAHPPPNPAQVADAIVPKVGLYSAPGDPEPAEFANNPTWEGLPGVYLVMQSSGDWLEVQVSMRPNESTAWIKASEVTVRQTPYRIFIDTGALRLVAYDGAKPFLDTKVAVGTGDSPTPTGNYFVDGRVSGLDPGGPYGTHQVSVAAFSNVYSTFGGGVGQIAIHGTNDPAKLGTPASHGCVRMLNDDIAKLADMVPDGTPVQIV
jgi:lipoprotein-anchoring transpeptidase ErfK/SrfK